MAPSPFFFFFNFSVKETKKINKNKALWLYLFSLAPGLGRCVWKQKRGTGCVSALLPAWCGAQRGAEGSFALASDMCWLPTSITLLLSQVHFLKEVTNAELGERKKLHEINMDSEKKMSIAVF